MKTNADIYAAYAELETAAEAFYTAATKLGLLVPEVKFTLDSVCDDINFAVVHVDTELDEVI